ncbi:phosphoribosyltransferase family protein [Leucobacter sp. UT-8R-CII-1-4]|uniref:ComF family protein n=1 Tax=Leucobacter sp. UT-8R-CII-1-4 TaxID=3040075 RepID=UPI0024A83518|nr:phosphoribosyltransferase family protein [Leucobacter sp. UT-8R-CII-1-4]MDI6023783.1 phosphoribosyltransferase family protein [Leucobacter sp. UT-8R-CII-1-4]
MREKRGALRELWLDLRSILWPCSCVICGAANRELCLPCETGLRATIGRAGRVAAPLLAEVWAYGPYEGAMRRLIVKYKHGGAIRFAPLLGALFAGPLVAALERGSGSALIVTAPSRIERVRSRGYRHLDLIVSHSLRYITRQGHKRGQLGSFLPGALQAAPGRAGQLGLSAADRIRNAKKVRVPRHLHSRLQGSEVVLVDDIMTTGATLNAAMQALAAVGARVVAVAIMNNTQRKDEINSDGLLNNVELEGATAVGFEKGVKVRPPMWPPA